MEKIPTAKQLMEKNWSNYHWDQRTAEAFAIEFAKLHVEAALKAVHEKGLDHITEWEGNPYTGEGSDSLSEEKLLKTYPLENIK